LDSNVPDGQYQDQVLPHVSRTFALTIPQLPMALRSAVTNAYLLCRIADTIEDEPAIAPAATLALLQRFVAVVHGQESAQALSQELAAQLSPRTLPAERDLILHMDRVVRVTAALREDQRGAIQRCVEVMCGGMHEFQRTASLRGLPRSSDMDDYCYYVAGVVGQMLTELFCGYSPQIMQHRSALHDLATSFAQGLQMTNILKDVWEDRARGACWLPQDVFMRHGVDLAQLSAQNADARVNAALRELTGVAHAHLRNALDYTLLIPPQETGIRRFCLWAVGLAILTLRRIDRTPGFSSARQVKISHGEVAMTRWLTSLAVRSDWLLRLLFERAASGVPLAADASLRRTVRPMPVAAVAASPAAMTEFNHGARYAPMEGTGRRSEGRSVR
jgi:farnesyl-diphosphate farnesyltransferase